MRRMTLLTLVLFVTEAGAEWRPVTNKLLKAEKTGFGGLCGVVVDHGSGDLYVNLSDRGIFRSSDLGETWQSLEVFKGRTEWPGCLMIDPLGDGKRMVGAFVYGAPIGISRDLGQTWRFVSPKSSHVDWLAVDWSDPDLRWILTLKHESGDLLLQSRDGGATFEELGKGYGPAWIFNREVAVVAQAKTKSKPQPALLRTVDGGKSFEPCGDYHARAMPRWHSGTLYWVVEGAVIRTSDQGKTWTRVSDLKDGRCGPVFGKTAEHQFLLTGKGIVESRDSGRTWSPPLALPKEMKGASPLSWIEYDPVHEALYVMRMGSELYRHDRK